MSIATADVHAPAEKRILRVRVVDMTKDGKPAVNVNVPVSFVKFGLKLAKAYSPEMKDVDIDWETIMAMVDSGELGKIVEVDDEVKHTHVEVWIE